MFLDYFLPIFIISVLFYSEKVKVRNVCCAMEYILISHGVSILNTVDIPSSNNYTQTIPVVAVQYSILGNPINRDKMGASQPKLGPIGDPSHHHQQLILPPSIWG